MAPGNGVGEGPQRFVIRAEERPLAKGRQVAGDEKFCAWTQQMYKELVSELGNVVKPYHVIQVLDFEDGRAHSALRMNVGQLNNDAQIKTAVDQLVTTVQQLTQLS